MILTTIALVAQAQPCAPDPFTDTGAPFTAANVDATAKAWFISLQCGKVFQASQLDPQERAIFTPAHIAEFAGALRNVGAPVRFERALTQSGHGSTAYAFRVAFADGTTTLFVMVVHDEKISGLAFAPAPDESHIRAWYDGLAKGTLLDASELSESLRKGMSAAVLFQVRSNLEASGVPTAFTLYDVRSGSDSVSFTYKVTYASAPPLLFIYSKNKAGQVDGLWFKPPSP